MTAHEATHKVINKQAVNAILVLYFAVLAVLNFRKVKRVIGVTADIYSRLEPTSRTRASRPFIICNLSRRTSVTILRKFVICISFRMYFVSSATYQLHEVMPSLNEFSPRAFLSSVHAAPFRPPGVSGMFFFVFASGSLSRRIKIPVFSPRPTWSELRGI